MKISNRTILLCAAVISIFSLGVSSATQTFFPLLSGPNDPLASLDDSLSYCGVPLRDKEGVIIRNPKVPEAFQRIHPCPSTGIQTGACPGWARNHTRPLACGGCDAVWNMGWMRNDIKKINDSYERKLYGGIVPGTSCTQPTPTNHL